MKRVSWSQLSDHDFISVSRTSGNRVLLDQAWLRFDLGRTLFITAGKQHVKWGTSRFWNPTDFLQRKRNPLEPFDVRTGVNMVKLPIRFMKINDDIAIWSAPVEMFCEISNSVRERSPFPFTFFFGYTNGSLGYLPSAQAWEEGGYEPGVSPFTPAVEKDLTEAVIGYLQGELRAPAKR